MKNQDSINLIKAKISEALSASLAAKKKETPFLFNTVEVRQEEISQGHFATYDSNVGWNAALEMVESKIKSALETIDWGDEIK